MKFFPQSFGRFYLPEGRVARLSFFLLSAAFDFFPALLVLCFAVLSGMIGKEILPVAALLLIAQLFSAYVFFILCAKRFHDLDKSAWYALLVAIIYFGALFIPALSQLSYVIIIILSLKKGTVGPNKYGIDPLGVETNPSVETK